ncbi:MAG: hypothetical protein JW723_00880 [Bacteroidales bacterium]|nr:hypothetical protein [Bacteroidales bacterium]
MDWGIIILIIIAIPVFYLINRKFILSIIENSWIFTKKGRAKVRSIREQVAKELTEELTKAYSGEICPICKSPKKPEEDICPSCGERTVEICPGCKNKKIVTLTCLNCGRDS